jgi:flavin-dependent dehydrogenase
MKSDVVVIGAGPAGATAAKVLAEHGASVLLVDKQGFPRDKPCGGGITTRALRRFPYLQREHLIDSYSNCMHVFSSSLANQAHLEYAQPLIAMVRRTHFDAGLVRLAEESGAILKTGIAARRIVPEADGAQVFLEDGTTIGTSSVIVADGMGSHIARGLGHPADRHHVGVCIVEEHPVPRPVMDQLYTEGRHVQVVLNPFGIAGYGWVFPKGEHVNIGLGEFYHALPVDSSRKNLKQLYADFIMLLKKRKIIPDAKIGRAHV